MTHKVKENINRDMSYNNKKGDFYAGGIYFSDCFDYNRLGDSYYHSRPFFQRKGAQKCPRLTWYHERKIWEGWDYKGDLWRGEKKKGKFLTLFYENDIKQAS